MIPAGYSDLAELLADAGGVVSGAAAIGATLGYVVGAVARDSGMRAEPVRAAEAGAIFGGCAGLAAWVYRSLGVQ